MERRPQLTNEAILYSLSITGKPLHVQTLSESKSKIRLHSVDFGQRTPIIYNRGDKAYKILNKTSIISTEKHQNPTPKTFLNKNLKKISVPEPYELDSGTKIYKCMSNPNVNGNSSTFGVPLRASTALNDTQLVFKPQFTLKKKINAQKPNRVRTKVRPENLSKQLQKSNGICCKEEEDAVYKYFIGPGNNSGLIFKVMKRRPRWKRVYSVNGAHFCWTAVKKYQIFEGMPGFEPTDEVIVTQAHSETPAVLPHDLYYHILPCRQVLSSKIRLYNKLAENKELASKKRLFVNMHSFYTSIGIEPFTKLPLTFHVTYGSYDPNFKGFIQKFHEFQKNGAANLWIVKPGECTNRGVGISVCRTLDQVIEAVNDYDSEYDRTFIIQKYVENPFLYQNRKFDIRVYALISCVQGNFQGFFYREGYLRTSCVEFSLKNVENRYIHLTNDAVQKNSSSYGKHEAGNKLSYTEFQEYLNSTHPDLDFFTKILPQIKSLVTDTILATYSKLDPEKKLHSFEILGYDFMVDSDCKVWLIEVNTNPCLELSSPYLEILIPKMIDHAFALTVDQLFPFDSGSNDFEMVFNEAVLSLNK